MYIYLLEYYSASLIIKHSRDCTDTMLELVRISVLMRFAWKKFVLKSYKLKMYLGTRSRNQIQRSWRLTNSVLALIMEMTLLSQSQTSLLDIGKIWSHPVIYSLPRVNGEFGKGPF